MKRMKLQYILFGMMGLYGTAIHAQNIGINKSGANPSSQAILDLNTGNNGNQGFLPPQVALTATNSALPVTSPATGLVVYNTASAGTAPNNVVPGYYYWNGSAWVLELTPGVGTTGQVLISNGGGMPVWGNSQSNLNTYNIVTSTQGVNITNGNNQVVGSGNVSVDIAAVSTSSPGLVPAPTGNNYGFITNNTGGAYWAPANGAITTYTVSTSTSGVTIGNGGNQVVTSNMSFNVNTNSKSSPGLVPSPGGDNLIYLSDASGNPKWGSGNPLVTTNNIVSGNTVLSIANGTGQVVGSSNVTLTAQPNGLGQTGYVAGPTLANANEVWGANGSGVPGWMPAVNILSTNSMTTSTPGVVITNGGSQLVGNGNAAFDVQDNSQSLAGLVTAGSGHNLNVWGTNGSGTPAWRTVSQTLSTANIVNGGANSPVVIGKGTSQVVNYILGNASVDVQGTAGGVMYGAGASSATFNSAGLNNQILYSNGSGVPAWTTSTYPTGAIAANALLYASGANAVGALAPAATANYVLATLVANGPPVWSNPNSLLTNSNLTTAGNGVIAVTNGTTQVVGPSNATLDVAGTGGGVLYGTGASSNFTAAGTANQLFYSNGSGAPAWSSPTYPTGSITANDLFWFSANNTISALPTGANGTILYSASGVPTWTNPGSIGLVTGSGITNYLARWTSTTTLGTGVTQDNGTDVGINVTPNTAYRMQVNESGANNVAIFGNNTAVNGASSGNGVSGITAQSGGYGVYGQNSYANGTGVVGLGNGVNGSDTVAGGSGGAFASTGIGAFGYATTANGAGVYGAYNSAYNGAGVLGVGFGGSPSQLVSNGLNVGVEGIYGGGSYGPGAGVIGLAGAGLAQLPVGTYYASVLGASSNASTYGAEGVNSNSSGWAVAAVNTNGPTGNGLLVSGTSSLNGVVNVGSPSTTNGDIIENNGGDNNSINIASGVTVASYGMTLPVSQGVAFSFITNNGSGVLSWPAAIIPVTGANNGLIIIGTTLQLGNNPLIQNTAIQLSGYNLAFTGFGNVQVGNPSVNTAQLQFFNSGSGDTLTIMPGVTTASYNLTLPVTAGAAGTLLTNNGNGALNWSATPVSASNGLSVNQNNVVQLGGALTQNTVINASSNNYNQSYDLGFGSTPGLGTFSITNGGNSNTYLQVQNQQVTGNPGQVGVGTNSPNPSAVLDVTSVTGGLLLPRLTAFQVANLATPAAGLMIFNTALGCVQYNNGSAWYSIAGACVCTQGPGNAGTITANNSSVCGGNAQQTFSITAVAGASSYVWTESPDAFTITSGYGTNNITVTMPTPANQATETITVTPVNGCGSGKSSTTTVTVIVAPATPGPISGPNPACAGQTATYSIAVVANASTYAWTVPAGWTINNGQGTNIISVTIGSSSGSVCVTPANGNCPSGTPSCISVLVNTNPPGTPGNITGPATLCFGTTNNTYSIAPVSGANGYTWSVSAAIGTITSGQGTNIITVTAANTNGSGSVSVFAYNACGNTSTSTLAVICTTAPAQPGPITASAQAMFANCTYQFSIAAVANAVTYTWVVPANLGSIISGQGTTLINVQGSFTGGNGFITVNATNGCGTSATTVIPVSDVGGTHGKLFFYYNGSNQYNGTVQTFTVPVCATMTVEMWGAGGGQGYYYGSVGGSSSYMLGTTNVTPGQVVYVIVGAGGAYLNENTNEMYGGGGWEYYGGCGGGRAAIQFASGTDIATAAGGGGGGNGDNYYYSFYYGMGGAGGYNYTSSSAVQGLQNNGWSSGECTTDFGYGATCTAGGVGAIGECGSYTTYGGFNGTQYTGASSGYSYYGGGGGGGYWGGGGGAGIYCTGGGGGESYPCGSNANFTVITAASGSTNPNTSYRNTRLLPAGTSSPNYNVGNPSANQVGSSISTFEANPGVSGYGGNGEVVLTY